MALIKEEKAAKAAEKAAEVAAKKEAGKDATVVQMENGATRVYSKDVHGDNHAELAAEFASKDERRKVL